MAVGCVQKSDLIELVLLLILAGPRELRRRIDNCGRIEIITLISRNPMNSAVFLTAASINLIA